MSKPDGKKKNPEKRGKQRRQPPQQASQEPKKEDQGTRPAPPKYDPRGRRGGPEANIVQQVREEMDRKVRKLQDEIARLIKRESIEKGLHEKVEELAAELNTSKQNLGNAQGSNIALRAQRGKQVEKLASEVKDLRKQLKTNKAAYQAKSDRLQKQLEAARNVAKAPAKKDPKAIRKLRNKLEARDEKINDLRQRCQIYLDEMDARAEDTRDFLRAPGIDALYPMIHVTLRAHVPDSVPMIMLPKEHLRFPVSLKLPDGRTAFVSGIVDGARGILVPVNWKVHMPPVKDTEAAGAAEAEKDQQEIATTTTGRMQSKVPNLSNPPRSDPADEVNSVAQKSAAECHDAAVALLVKDNSKPELRELVEGYGLKLRVKATKQELADAYFIELMRRTTKAA